MPCSEGERKSSEHESSEDCFGGECWIGAEILKSGIPRILEALFPVVFGSAFADSFLLCSALPRMGDLDPLAGLSEVAAGIVGAGRLFLPKAARAASFKVFLECADFSLLIMGSKES